MKKTKTDSRIIQHRKKIRKPWSLNVLFFFKEVSVSISSKTERNAWHECKCVKLFVTIVLKRINLFLRESSFTSFYISVNILKQKTYKILQPLFLDRAHFPGSSCLQIFFRMGVLRNFENFIGKQLWWVLRPSGLQLC